MSKPTFLFTPSKSNLKWLRCDQNKNEITFLWGDRGLRGIELNVTSEWHRFEIVWQDKLFCLGHRQKLVLSWKFCQKTRLILGLDRIGLESWISRSRRSVLLSTKFSKTNTNQNLKVLSWLRPIPCLKRYRLDFRQRV